MKRSIVRSAVASAGSALAVVAALASSGQVQADTVAQNVFEIKCEPHGAALQTQANAHPAAIPNCVTLHGLVGVTSTGEREIATQVPVPAAAWLFGSAIVGAVALGRRKKMALHEQGQHIPSSATPGGAGVSLHVLTMQQT